MSEGNVEKMMERVQALAEYIEGGITPEHTLGDIGAALSYIAGSALATEDHAAIERWLNTFGRTTRAQALRATIAIEIESARAGRV